MGLNKLMVKNKNVKKLALGSAQLGQEYGIANMTGKPEQKEALKILEHAMDYGINTIDTAPGYGESEKIIGNYIFERRKKGLDIPIIITKIPFLNLVNENLSKTVYTHLLDSIISSLKRLKIDIIDICLLHSPADMTSFDGQVVQNLLKIKQEGVIKKTGVSVYKPEEVQKVIDLNCFDIIEVPLNILDHRLIQTGLLQQLSDHQIEVYVRSVFLQGLLFYKPDNLPQNFEMAKAVLEKLKFLSLETGLKPHELSLLFIRDLGTIDKILIGCETLEQLKNNIDIINLPQLDISIRKKIEEYFSDISENIINPTLW